MGKDQQDDKRQATASEQDIIAAGTEAAAAANVSVIGEIQNLAPRSKRGEKSLDPVIAGARIPVSPAEIDRELVQIWKATTSRQKDEDRGAVSLLRAMNLIVYVDSDERAQMVDQVIGQVTGRHPCRTILIIERPGEIEDLDSWISAHCTLPQTADRYICSEQITIAATGPAVMRVPNMALNLLVTDLPVFLWWDTRSPFAGFVRDHLVASLDRVIVDSALWDNPLEALTTLADLAVNNAGERFAPTDFNWGRLTIFRESTAQFFDGPVQRPFLDRLALVQVQYGDGGATQSSNPIQALLYVGWLASRLGWTLQRSPAETSQSRNRDHVFHFKEGPRGIQVVLRPTPATKEISQGVMAARLATGGPDRATFDITLNSGACTTTIVDTKTGEQVHRTRVWLAPTEANLLDQDLELFGRDQMYDEALQMAAQMALANPAMRQALTAEAAEEDNNRRAFDPRF